MANEGRVGRKYSMATNLANYSTSEIRSLGFAALGKNIQIARNCAFYGIEHISLGDNVRIDSCTTITASAEHGVTLGSFVHIGCFCYISGGGGVVFEDYAGLSAGVHLFSASDDYSGKAMTNPTVPLPYTASICGEIRLCRFAIIGAKSIVLPGCCLHEGAALGALSLANKNLQAWTIYGGCPAKQLKARERAPLALSKKLEQDPRFSNLFR